MTFTFFSNYFNHHQKALCDALYERLKEGFTFVETQPMEEFRTNMGWGKEEIPAYVLKSHLSQENERKAMELGRTSDVVMIGSAPECFVEPRIEENRLTFRYTERPLKEGWIKMFIPRLTKKFYHLHFRNRNKNVYLLGASAYAAADYKLLHSYPDKCYKFGYFPAIHNRELELLMREKSVNDPPVLLWAGRFLKLKRADLLIQALGELKKKGIRFQLKLIGNGEEEATLKKLVKEQGLQSRVMFPGFLTPEEVRVEMEKANIFIMTSNFLEGWGSVIYEALSAGCAVIASHACGSAPWLVKDNVSGYIFESGNVKSLTSQLEKLLLDEKLTEKLGRNAYMQMQQLWNPETAASRLLELSEGLLRGEKVTFDEGPLSPAPVLKNHWL